MAQTTRLAAVLLLALTLLVSAPATAASSADEEVSAAAETPAADHEGHHDDDHHSGHGHGYPNMLGAFIGFTGRTPGDRNVTLGIEYNRWLTDSWGLGAGVERAWGDLDYTIYTIPVSYRTGPWKFSLGPGWEDPDSDNPPPEVTPFASDGGDGSTLFLVRFSVEYVYHYGQFEVAPKAMVDFIDGDQVYVFGMVLGWGF